MTSSKQIFLLSIFCYFMQGAEKLYSQPFNFYLKNLGWSASKLMYVGTLLSLFWVIKPLIGFYIDRYFTKKGWLMFSLIGSLLLSILLFNTLPLWLVLICMFFTNSNAAIRDIATDGLSVEMSRDSGLAEKLQSVQWIAITIAGLLVSLGGGYIADHYKWNYSFGILIPLYVFFIWFLSSCNIGSSKAEQTSIKELFKHKELWWTVLFIFLYNYSPSFGTALYYKQVDIFKFSQTFIGILGAIGAVVSIGGAWIFHKFAHTWNFKKVIILSVFIGAITTLSYLWYTPITCIVFDVCYSLIGMVINLLLLTYMVKSSIKGLESLSFALLCSITNLASTASSLSGAYLLDKIGLNPLIILSSVTSFACLLLIPKIFPKKDLTNTNINVIL